MATSALTDRPSSTRSLGTRAGRRTLGAWVVVGATTVLACRDRSKGEAAVEAIRRRVGHDGVHIVHLDLADFGSVRACAMRRGSTEPSTRMSKRRPHGNCERLEHVLRQLGD